MNNSHLKTVPSPGSTSVQEFSIRVPKNSRKRYHVMKFNSVLNVDFAKWGPVKMERENNQKEFARPEDELPKFGAGSEYGREAKEEARRKKFGIVSRKYKPEDQPWILKSGGKTGKKFKGIREGGVGDNAAFYVFTHAADGAIDAYPLCEWYNFHPINRYKSLSAEEAEQEFTKRNKDLFSIMKRKRLRIEEEGDLDEDEGKTKKNKKKSKKSKELKISDMDDWVDSDEEDSMDEDEGEDDEVKEKKAKKKKQTKKDAKKKKKGSDDSALEESDDGDEEGRELDYISDSSDSDSDHEAKIDKDMKGVAEESALRRLLSSGEEDEDEEKEEGKKSEEEQDKEEDKDKPAKKKKKAVKKEKDEKESNKSKTEKNEESSTEFSADSTDSEGENKGKHLQNSANSSRCTSPTGGELKRPGGSLDGSTQKKPRLEALPTNFNSSDSGITEDAVRRYLMRKPMTTTELLQKFKSKKTGLTSEQLVNVMTQLLKKINPVKQTIKGKMFLSLKPS